jgi:hypothetical protein
MFCLLLSRQVDEKAESNLLFRKILSLSWQNFFLRMWKLPDMNLIYSHLLLSIIISRSIGTGIASIILHPILFKNLFKNVWPNLSFVFFQYVHTIGHFNTFFRRGLPPFSSLLVCSEGENTLGCCCWPESRFEFGPAFQRTTNWATLQSAPLLIYAHIWRYEYTVLYDLNSCAAINVHLVIY